MKQRQQRKAHQSRQAMRVKSMRRLSRPATRRSEKWTASSMLWKQTSLLDATFSLGLMVSAVLKQDYTEQ